MLDSLVCSVAGFEVHNGGPVVGKILGESAGCASGSLADIFGRVHGRVEAVTTDDLVEMRRGDDTRLDERVETLNAQGRASETEVRLRGGGKRRSEG